MLSVLLLLLALVLALLLAALAPKRWLLVPVGLLLVALLVSPDPLIAQKFIGRLAMPGGLLWLGLIGSCLHLLRAKARIAPAALGFLLVYSLFGNLYVGALLLRWLEADYVGAQRLNQPEERFDALLVLGGGNNVSPAHETPQLAYAGDRLMLAARMYHQDQAKLLVASGMSMAGIEQAFDRSLGSETRQIWMELKIPKEAIIVLDGPRNTKEEIKAYAELLKQERWSRVGLVTSAWHMRRAMRLAQRAGLSLIPVPADFRGSIGYPSLVGAVPSGQGLYKSSTAAWELLGALVGR